jgi:Arc/MetJ-type ribon-helix-helix transcriptional regulator
MAPLTDPFNIRLSLSQIQFVDALCESRGIVSRPAAIRHLIEEAKEREARRQRADQRRQGAAA